MFYYGHWAFDQEIPDNHNYIGFIYKITNLVSGKAYIGRKQMTSTTRKSVPCKTKNEKKNIRVTKPSKWMTYTGSCVRLNNDIASLGKQRFRFEILSLHTCKSSLNYEEVYQLIVQGAMTKLLPDGTPAFYNGLIPPVRTRPPYQQ